MIPTKFSIHWKTFLEILYRSSWTARFFLSLLVKFSCNHETIMLKFCRTKPHSRWRREHRYRRVVMAFHQYNDVIMGAVASQITSLTIVYSTVDSDVDQRKHQSSASLAFVRGIHRGPVNSPHKWPVTQKMFPFDDVIMLSLQGWLVWGTGTQENLGAADLSTTAAHQSEYQVPGSDHFPGKLNNLDSLNFFLTQYRYCPKQFSDPAGVGLNNIFNNNHSGGINHKHIPYALGRVMQMCTNHQFDMDGNITTYWRTSS